MADAAIDIDGVVKEFAGKPPVRALSGLDLHVPEGSVVGLLGPNGAGKTTAVRVLSTLIRPDGGTARVLGHDVVREPAAVRRLVGLSGQFSAIDEKLTGAENLWMFGRLYGLDSAAARSRAGELLELFDLADAGDRIAATYSGGMKRRLDLAGSLVAHPRVLFLDEPTTGLDPRSRLDLWDVIRARKAEGVSLLLTTQYLEEADALADSIAVIDHGRVIASGTSDQLKREIGGERIEVVVRTTDQIASARDVLSRHGDGEVLVDDPARKVAVTCPGGASRLAQVIRDLDAAAVEIDDIGMHRPTLDDVFLALTGHVAEEEEEKEGATP